MTKILPKNLPLKEKKELLSEFYNFISSLDREESENFFDNFLTPSEKIIFARRLRVAKMLLQGRDSLWIRKELKAGVSTIQFVRNWLKDELKEREKEQKSSKSQSRIDK